MDTATKVNPPNSPEIHQLTILAEQTSQLYAAVSSALIATLINALILVSVLWSVIDHDILLSWLLVIVVISLARGITSYQYKKAAPQQDEAPFWYHRFLFGSLLASLAWGVSSILLFPVDDLARQVFLAFVIGGMAAGAITSLSHIKLPIYFYLGFSLIPLLIRFLYSETELGIAMGTMVTLYLVMMLLAANRTHNNIKQNICLHIESIEREWSLQQSEHRYQTLLETATDAFFLHDLQGNIIDVNEQACISLGYTHDELLNMSVADIEVDSDNLQFTQLIPKLDKSKHACIEGIHRRKDGTTFPVEASLGMVHMGSDTLVTVFARDITERKRIDKMKNEFISTVSHELRTPLTSIRGSLGLMSGGAVGELPEQAKEMLKLAGNNTERLLLLINDILDIQKIESGQLALNMTELDISSFLKQALEDNAAYGEQYNVKFVLIKEVKDTRIYADKDRLMQVMANLLSNAAKFSAEGETVEISVDHHQDHFVRISVKDHGPGIAESFHDKVFDKFTQSDSSDTRQKGGTGLGLSITKNIVEKHGGHISFVSKEGVGTTFNVDLPVYTA